jgi:hypothetical protein
LVEFQELVEAMTVGLMAEVVPVSGLADMAGVAYYIAYEAHLDRFVPAVSLVDESYYP